MRRSLAAATDYANPDVWLCRPGRQEACSAPQDATIIAANGKLTREAFHPAKNPPIDCFYVYPTVSNEPGGNSDLNVTGAEKIGGEYAICALRYQVPFICSHVSAGHAYCFTRDDCG